MQTWYDAPINNDISTSLQELKASYYQNDEGTASSQLRSSQAANRHGPYSKGTAVGDSIFSINPSWIEARTREVKLNKSRIHNKVSMKQEPYAPAQVSKGARKVIYQ